jgi:hypothetical protein
VWEEVGPWLLVALLVGLALAGLPWLFTLIPDEATSFLIQTLQDFEQIRDIQAQVLVVIERSEGAQCLKLDLLWLREAGAARAALRWPPQLSGEVFAYHSGRLTHYLPSSDPQQTGGVIVRVTLDQAGVPALEELVDRLVNALRRGELEATISQQVFGEGWDRLWKWAAGWGHELAVPGLAQDLVPKSLRAWPEGFTVWLPNIPPLPGPRRLEIAGGLKEWPHFRRLELWFPPGAFLPSNARLLLGGEEETVLWLSLRGVRVNQGLALREVLTLPPARAVIWE